MELQSQDDATAFMQKCVLLREKNKTIKEQENATGPVDSARDYPEEHMKMKYKPSKQGEHEINSPETLGLLDEVEECPSDIMPDLEAGASGLKKKAKPRYYFLNFFPKCCFGMSDENEDDAEMEQISFALLPTE